MAGNSQFRIFPRVTCSACICAAFNFAKIHKYPQTGNNVKRKIFNFGYSASCNKSQISSVFQFSKAFQFHKAEHAQVYKDLNAFLVKRNIEAPSSGKISLKKIEHDTRMLMLILRGKPSTFLTPGR